MTHDTPDALVVTYRHTNDPKSYGELWKNAYDIREQLTLLSDVAEGLDLALQDIFVPLDEDQSDPVMEIQSGTSLGIHMEQSLNSLVCIRKDIEKIINRLSI